jgi:flagellar hook-length control protein FliK
LPGTSNNGAAQVERPQLTETDQVRFIERVARAFRVTEGREGLVRLRLNPPELGSLKVEIRLQSGALTAHLEAETPQARSLLVDNLSMLRERLAEHGVRIEQFDVDLADRHSGGSYQRPDHDASGSANRQATTERNNAPQREAEDLPAQNTQRVRQASPRDDQIDVVI